MKQQDYKIQVDFKMGIMDPGQAAAWQRLWDRLLQDCLYTVEKIPNEAYTEERMPGETG